MGRGLILIQLGRHVSFIVVISGFNALEASLLWEAQDIKRTCSTSVGELDLSLGVDVKHRLHVERQDPGQACDILSHHVWKEGLHRRSLAD